MHRRFLIYHKCFWLIAVLLAGSWAFAADGVKVGLRKQLLVDDWVVAEKRGMVRELVEKYAEFAGLYPMVVATGGDAELLFEDYNLMDRIVPDLTLRGIALALQTHAQKAES